MNNFSFIHAQWKVLALGVTVGVLCATAYAEYSQHTSWQAKQEHNTCRSQYPLTNRTLGCLSFDSASDRIHLLDSKLDALTARYVSEGKARRVSVFVRDLANQQWAASNENEVYAPASMLKLPLVMTYYKLAELDPSIMLEPLAYTASSKNTYADQDYVPQNQLVAGHSYTVNELIKHVLIESDNNAADLLYSHINPDLFKQTAIDLGITIPAGYSQVDFVTPKTDAGIYRILYNSSYLNRTSSEETLELLGQSTFKGIATDIPPSVTVAHKFGERQMDSASGAPTMRQLHDCGIVYKNPNPYVVCIMTEGSDFDSLLSIIKNISGLVYQTI